MNDPITLAGFLTTALCFAVGWGRLLWYLAEHSVLVRRATIAALAHTRRPLPEVRSWLLTVLYCGTGLLVGFLFAAVWRLPPETRRPDLGTQVALTLLGTTGAISFTALWVHAGSSLMRAGPERFREMREVPWMAGLRQFPPAFVPWVAAGSAAVEELLFRGVLLRLLLDRFGVAAWIAIAVAGALFCLQQLLQLRTPFQRMVVGGACVALSLAGGLLVVLTGGGLSAVICHASFVVFYLPERGTGNRQQRAAGARREGQRW